MRHQQRWETVIYKVSALLLALQWVLPGREPGAAVAALVLVAFSVTGVARGRSPVLRTPAAALVNVVGFSVAMVQNRGAMPTPFLIAVWVVLVGLFVAIWLVVQ